MNRNEKVTLIKKIAAWGSKFCVSAFFSALSANAAGNEKGKKVEKYVAMTGGYLVGSMVGDKVSEYVCKGIDDIYAEYERLEAESSATEPLNTVDGLEGGENNA